MADHGTVGLFTPDLGGMEGTFVTDAKSLNYGTAGMTTTPMDSFPTGMYGIAGTVDNSYKSPTQGQLWPRGDLDAI